MELESDMLGVYQYGIIYYNNRIYQKLEYCIFGKGHCKCATF